MARGNGGERLVRDLGRPRLCDEPITAFVSRSRKLPSFEVVLCLLEVPIVLIAGSPF
jgi:hypothetical protein